MVCDVNNTGAVLDIIRVLILILLEYGLRRPHWCPSKGQKPVLILILLEYGLRHIVTHCYCTDKACLNPYSIGIWSATALRYKHQIIFFLS